MYQPGLVIGHEFSGVIEELGGGVEGLRLGDRVMANSVIGCGVCRPCRQGKENLCQGSFRLGVSDDGAMAQWVKVPASRVFNLPDNLGLEEACLAEPMAIALHGVHRSEFWVGNTVVVVGAGTIGLSVLSLLKRGGASKAWVVETNPFRVDLALRLGADRVFDPSCTNVSSELSSQTEGKGVDVVFECVWS